MKQSIKNIRAGLTCAAAQVFLSRNSYIQSMRLGAAVGAPMASMPAMAALTTGFANLNSLAQLGISLMIALGMLGGLGFVLGACVSLFKKYDRGNDDITWGKIGMQFFAGGLGMALSWVGIQIVETLGGSASDIGRSLK
jgi:hypothetical protein